MTTHIKHSTNLPILGINEPVRNVQKFTEEVKKSVRRLTKRQALMVETTGQLLLMLPNKKAVAKKIGISTTMLYKRLKRYPEIEQYTNIFREETLNFAKNKLLRYVPTAAENVIALAGGAQSETVRLDSNKEVLDRAGLLKPQSNNVQINILNDLKRDRDEYR